MPTTPYLSPADAARALGVSAKALRLYEERGLITPGRTHAGWRAYGPEELECAKGIVARPIFAMTRSSAMLDLTTVTAGEAILLCPANHSPPMFVVPHAGAQGYEAVTTCLAPPDVRARTEGVIAIRPPAA